MAAVAERVAVTEEGWVEVYDRRMLTRAMVVLGRNIAIAGALCAVGMDAWEHGYSDGHADGSREGFAAARSALTA